MGWFSSAPSRPAEPAEIEDLRVGSVLVGRVHMIELSGEIPPTADRPYVQHVIVRLDPVTSDGLVSALAETTRRVRRLNAFRRGR